MRIVGGSAKGRKLKSPVGDARPTASRVRESIFNILQGRIEGARFLDLFAGSGAVGLEALSRGAEKVVFVEENRARAEAIERFVRELGWNERAVVIRIPAAKYLARGHCGEFDVVFADPPYRTDDMNAILTVLPSDLIAPDGVLVLEHLASMPAPDEISGFGPPRRYRYGDTTLSVYRKTVSGQAVSGMA
jgi:16S rRNA (guanine(966)-N(2))-methyltransferase RsmD